MKIGLFGYGKMGQAIERLAAAEGIEIAWRISRENRPENLAATLRQADVIIEFTRPEVAFENVLACLAAGKPVVSGTTGWANGLPLAQDFCRHNNGALLWAANFSVGVNLFFALNRHLARLMQPRPEYQPSLSETHHIHKLDAPSGTAIALAEGILAENPQKRAWKLASENPSAEDLPIQAFRTGEVPGTHEVVWRSQNDQISIQHEAFSRDGFAAGALLAAKWIFGKTGVFTMQDVLFGMMNEE